MNNYDFTNQVFSQEELNSDLPAAPSDYLSNASNGFIKIANIKVKAKRDNSRFKRRL